MSCLYRALSYFHQQYSTEQMRDTLCRYLSSNPDLSTGPADRVVEWETGQSLPQYIRKMRLPSSWGGAIEIKAYADLFQKNIKVYSMPNRMSIDFMTKSNPDQANWIAISWTGSHYEPISSRQEHEIMERATQSTSNQSNLDGRNLNPNNRNRNGNGNKNRQGSRRRRH